MGWKVIAGLGLAGLAVAGLSACAQRLKAPKEAGVCYLIGHPSTGEVKFNPIARDQPDLEHCAVYIYNARMDMLATGTAHEVTEGSYGGNFLWATNREVRFSQHYESPRFPLLVKAPNGRLVQPGSIVEEAPTAGPQTVEIPDNLPQKTDDGVVVTQQPAQPAKP